MFIPFVRSSRAIGLAVACALAFAQPASSADAPLSYDALLARLDTLPATREADALRDAADARADQARALPNPSLSYDLESVYGSGPYSGRGNGESTLALSQPLELFGQRRARIDAARAEADATGIRSEQLRWQAAARLAEAYALAEAATRRHDLAVEALSLAEQDADAAEALVREGREAELRGVQARAETAAARAALDEARAIKDAEFARLTAVALLDTPPDDIGESLLDRAAPTHAEEDHEPLAVRIAAADMEAAGRRITLEERRSRPDITATLGQQRFRETGDNAVSVGLTLSIPLFDRNRGGIRAAYAEQRAAEARLFAQQQEVRADRMAAEAALRVSGSRTDAADSGVEAAAEAYRLARIGFDAGRISQLELRNTRAALVAARGTAVDARLARVRAEIELARIEGHAPFGTPSP